MIFLDKSSASYDRYQSLLSPITSIKDDVLRIRNGSFYSGPGDYTLFVLDGDMLHPRQVRLGECNYDYIEVISGLESGDQVIVSDMTKYKGKEKLKVE